MGHLAGLCGLGYRWQLTIVGGGRDAIAVWRRGRGKRLCARGACLAWSSGPSTSPLDGRLLRGTSRYAREGDTARLWLLFRVLRRIHRGPRIPDPGWPP